ncbi:MAG: NAD(P)H-dependent oxidoreductase [Calditrichaeota bacterium]|nr:NAD(P)H-dependent oxidoreductase [Calditrichota bacterium]MCB9365607.1 NAD(P)H-dependent oxidoreductase [Calditrichota bacterium]
MKIAVIPGSLRAGSYNRRLAGIAEDLLTQKGIETDILDLKLFSAPPYDGDLESASGIPAAMTDLKQRIAATHAVVISSPEYNGGVPGMLKNVLDWTTRGGGSPWPGKVVMLMGASEGPWGTNRMQSSLRYSFSTMGAIVLPQTVTIPRASTVWDERGTLLDTDLVSRMDKVLGQLLELTKKVTGATIP